MTDNNNPPIDGMPDGLDPEQLAALASVSDSFATARRLLVCVANNAERDDKGDSLRALLAEIAAGDPVSVALTLAVEGVRMALQLYGEHACAVLAVRCARQMALAERNRGQFGEPTT